MHRGFSFIILFLLTIASPCSATGVEEIPSVLVHFKDGEKLAIRDWNFEYEFGEEDGEGVSLLFTPKIKRLKNLCLMTDERRGSR